MHHNETKIRLGFVGCGWWATFAHLPAAREHPGAEIAALAEPDAARLAAAGEEFGVAARFGDHEAMLAEVELDAVVIAAPNALHHPVAKLALERDLHVLVEKPMVIQPAHGRELVALARARERQLIVGYPMHYNPQALELRAAIRGGEIGTVEHVSVLYSSIVRELYAGNPESYREAVFDYPVNAPAADTYRDSAMSGGGQGQSQASHAAALMLWLTGLRPRRVAAFTGAFELEVDLADALAIEFAGGAVGTLGSTGGMTAGNEEIVHYDISGRSGHVVFDVNRGIAEIHRAGGEVRELAVPSTADRYPERAPVRNLVDVAGGHGVNGSPGEIGLATAELIAALYRSAAADSVAVVGDDG